MAASLRSNVVATAMVMMMLQVSVSVSVSGQVQCPDEATPLVYPFWSTCFSPAVYYGQEVYQLRVGTSGSGLLAPEWDETNSTYYLRLADEGAQYALTHMITREYRSYVAQGQDVAFVNVASGRILSWREEGDDEYFLVEEELGNATSFRFAAAEDVPLPCPRIANARCQAYYLIDYTSTNSTGVSPYVEDGVTYFTLGSDTLPFLLRRNSTSATTYTSKSVTLPTFTKPVLQLAAPA